MKLRIEILYNGVTRTWPLLSGKDTFQIVSFPDVVHLEIFKSHDHSYSFVAFLYGRKRVVWPRSYSSKKELYGAIQKLLQEEL